MVEEYTSIMKSDVWEVVPRPEGKSMVTSNDCVRSSMLRMATLRSTKLDLWLEGFRR